jgi:hypothetical protein
MRVVLTILVLLGFLTTGCIYKQHAEQLASLITVVTPLARGENVYDLKLAPGPNEVFRLRKISGILFPFMFGATDLYLEISPQNLIDGRTLNLPSDGIAGYVCKEIHPGIYCSPATGQAHFLRVSPAWVDVQLKAENAELRENFTWSISRGIAFPRTGQR